MFMPKATLVALVSSLALISASPLLGTRQNGVTCQTSDGSPETGDITYVINELNGRGGNCYQSNDVASSE